MFLQWTVGEDSHLSHVRVISKQSDYGEVHEVSAHSSVAEVENSCAITLMGKYAGIAIQCSF